MLHAWFSPRPVPWAKKVRCTRAFFLESATGRLGRKIAFWEEGGSLQIALFSGPQFFRFLTHPPTHLPTSHRQARSGKARTQQGKMSLLKMRRLQRDFFPWTPTHPPTYPPLAVKHAAEKHAHSKDKNEAPKNVTPPAWLFSLTYPPTHLPTSHRHARSGKPRTQQGKMRPQKKLTPPA